VVPERPKLYGQMLGRLVTARAILDSVRDGRIDVGPLDAYWHVLIAKHQPSLTRGIRVLETTDVATMPAFVTAASTAPATVEALRDAFANASRRPWFAALADELSIDGFAPVDAADYERTLEWDREAKAAGYPFPA
jgi:ABC-type phosphate/phosphonate transport system substrate-binding protein